MIQSGEVLGTFHGSSGIDTGVATAKQIGQVLKAVKNAPSRGARHFVVLPGLRHRAFLLCFRSSCLLYQISPSLYLL